MISKKDSLVVYDENNVFQQILQGTLPCDRIYEDDHVLAFRDLNPQAKTHVLVIPKISCRDFTHFMSMANEKTVQGLLSGVMQVVKKLKLQNYRLILNNGQESGQVVFHMHVHILSNDVK